MASEIRRVTSLRDKRNRDALGLFVIEGDKLVREALALGAEVERVYADAEWIEQRPPSAARVSSFTAVSEAELRRLSALVTANRVLAVVRKPRPAFDWGVAAREPLLVLETVQDPGNLGSILRVAAWFGIPDVIASPDSADAYSAKVVQGSMGAIFRVRVHSLPPAAFVGEAQRRGVPIYAAALDGTSIYDAELDSRGLVLLGNESSGLSSELRELATQRLAIPPWSSGGPGLDSLNVAAAAAVFCSELRRRATRRGEEPGRASGSR